MDLFLTNTQLFASWDVNWWTGVVWITFGLLWCFFQLFGLSFWRHPFTAYLIHWWANDVMLHLSKSDEDTNLSTSRMGWRWVRFWQIFIFTPIFNLNRNYLVFLSCCRCSASQLLTFVEASWLEPVSPSQNLFISGGNV